MDAMDIDEQRELRNSLLELLQVFLLFDIQIIVITYYTAQNSPDVLGSIIGSVVCHIVYDS